MPGIVNSQVRAISAEGQPDRLDGQISIDVVSDIVRLALDARDVNGIAAQLDSVGRGTPTDLTWAFNQATGARYDHSLAVVRVAGPVPHQSPSINRRLPSLNRLPGTIYVPPGRHYIYGTIILFGGQQLVGASSLGDPNNPGSVLVKVGTGPCIRVLPPDDVEAFLEMHEEDILKIYTEGAAPNERSLGADDRLELTALDAGWLRESVSTVPVGDALPNEARRAVIAQITQSLASTLIRHLRIEFEELPDNLRPGLDLSSPGVPQEDATRGCTTFGNLLDRVEVQAENQHVSRSPVYLRAT